MRVRARYIPLILLLLSVGCKTSQESRELDLVYATVTLPQGFKPEWEPGDTPRGRLVSRDGKIVISFDLGFYAGAYAHQKRRDRFGSERGSSMPSHIRLRWIRGLRRLVR